ncbi:MAG: hypothetical protein JO147_10795 [Actinobacteria bacterium]|nr:hypothetical protein [Actinomycetota bacterium]
MGAPALACLVVDPEGTELAAARECEAEVFLDTYGNTHEQLLSEYGPYDSSSVFIAVLDDTGRAVGAVRLITPNDVGLKSIDDVGRPPWNQDGPRSARAAGLDLGHTWDVATIAVRRGAGAARGLAAAALYHGIWASARANVVRSIVMIMDERARRLLSASGIHTQRLPGTAPGYYLGSESSTPLYGHLAEMAVAQRRLNPEAARLIADGRGLEGIRLPGPGGFLLRDRRPVEPVGDEPLPSALTA